MADARAISLSEIIAFIRVQVRRGGYSIREGVATCPAELMLNIDAILDSAERGIANTTRHDPPPPPKDTDEFKGGVPRKSSQEVEGV